MGAKAKRPKNLRTSSHKKSSLSGTEGVILNRRAGVVTAAAVFQPFIMGMYWDLMPVFAIFVGVSIAPEKLRMLLAYVEHGVPFKRDLGPLHAFNMWQRDRTNPQGEEGYPGRRFWNKHYHVGCGNPYKTPGLEAYKEE